MHALDIIYQDQDLLVINKPAGLPVLRDRSGTTDLWSMLKASFKPYQLHRLDKGTSGVLMIAKNQQAQSRLTRQISQQQIHKFYIAIVAGTFPNHLTQVINLPLCKGRKSRYRVAGQRSSISRVENRYQVVSDRAGVEALTRARILTQRGPHSVLALKPVTGRTHQLRVHLSWLGHPILGDHLYGPADNQDQASRLMLHAHRVVLPGNLTFTAPLPHDWDDAIGA